MKKGKAMRIEASGQKQNAFCRRVVLKAVDSMAGSPFTTKQLWQAGKRIHRELSQATVYRVLGDLRAEGYIKDVVLDRGLRVCVRSDSDFCCIIECARCKKLTACPELARQMADSKWLSVRPSFMAIHVRGLCPSCDARQGLKKSG